MQPSHYYLDEILKQLQKDRTKPVAEREHLNADIVLREIINTDRHEDFIEMIQILLEDKMIKRVNENVGHLSEIDKSRDILITIKGSLFIENGGYSKQYVDKITTAQSALERNQRMERSELRLVNWTKAVAIGAIGLVIWEILKTFYIEPYLPHH